MTINQKRLVETFVELAKIDSESFFEKDIQEVLVSKLKDLGLKQVLIVTDAFEENLFLASRNLYRVEVCQPGTAEFNPVNLVGFDKVLITSAAVKKVEELLK